VTCAQTNEPHSGVIVQHRLMIFLIVTPNV